jgi:hypothetical protein
VSLYGQAILTATPAPSAAAADASLLAASTFTSDTATATAAAGDVQMRFGFVLDEYIPAGRPIIVIAAGSPASQTVYAGRKSDLVPAGKP